MKKRLLRILFAATIIFTVAMIGIAVAVFVATRPPASQHQALPDGSILVLKRVTVSPKVEIVHGFVLERLFGNVIPAKGLHLLNLKLDRPTKQYFGSSSGSWLVAEFQLVGPNATNNPFAKPAFSRQFRYVLHGDSGIEYVHEMWNLQFRPCREGLRGYVVANRFPRESPWLGIRVERRDSQNQPGPWHTVADFKIKNPAPAIVQPWVAQSVPTTQSLGGMDFILGQISVKTVPHLNNDIWNHMVHIPFEVRSNGILLTNWSAAYTHVEDATGNWDLFASHRSLDPKHVWKLETDFEMTSGFSADQVATVDVPRALPPPLVTNVGGVPVSISWSTAGSGPVTLGAGFPTNRPDLSLSFISAQDENGRPLQSSYGSWNKNHFWKGFSSAPNNAKIRVTFAVAPDIRLTYFAQPQLLPPDPPEIAK